MQLLSNDNLNVSSKSEAEIPHKNDQICVNKEIDHEIFCKC